MKILVIDDSAVNRRSALESLQGHEVTVLSSFDEAMEALIAPLPYDAVLIDLMMPMSSFLIGTRKVDKEDSPYGYVLALRAAYVGAKFVAVVTDADHHDGAMPAAIDLIDPHVSGLSGPNFTINGATCMFVHSSSPKNWGWLLEFLLYPLDVGHLRNFDNRWHSA